MNWFHARMHKNSSTIKHHLPTGCIKVFTSARDARQAISPAREYYSIVFAAAEGNSDIAGSDSGCMKTRRRLRRQPAPVSSCAEENSICCRAMVMLFIAASGWKPPADPESIVLSCPLSSCHQRPGRVVTSLEHHRLSPASIMIVLDR